ncbi:iron-containing redox enzyme family protein [Glycomyces sp. TRM65418]|uniref:iron-containing redox enzyme family protein n=1 Tax=Glycomyces sp. TRM65418 TaxID=2867006 RepID=UPI001CE550BC|nr:iron-containing redox enzyme family protein [Glycomyces sp. TRM65418]MCC3761582.1 iron-containing redox enzyme family protein [Glycomyces sp. TRM65418]QZD55677.1 iron-containing redox enzyme family protein [Glycomyces sp. TRM65418]
MSGDIVLDTGAAQQARSVLGGKLSVPAGETVERLYRQYFPPVPDFEGLPGPLEAFLHDGPQARDQRLAALRGDREAHGRFLHESLGELYPNVFGYRDSPCAETADDDLEVAMFSARVRLEREYLEHWLPFPDVPRFDDQRDAADHLDELAETNPGVHHPLFDYLATEAPIEHLEMFLRGETIRNEIVDDEVALLTVGLQGTQKAVVAANLWDECGRGKLENFHTFWLRRLIDASPGGWDGFAEYRTGHPWFAKITSNTNAMLLSRPAYVQQAYGCFLVFESWVAPHFVNLLAAMDRLGVHDDDRRIYFAAHVAVDPRHAQELADGLRFQRPEPTPGELHRVVQGAHLAAEAGRLQYDYWLSHFTGETAA